MKYYYNLYVSDSIREKKLNILSRIEKNEWIFGKFLVVLTQNEKNHLEFFDSALVTQKMVEKEKLFVVGLADGYGGAVKIVEKIVNDVLQATGGTDIRNYLLNEQMEYEKRNG